MPTIRVERDGKLPLAFEGELIGEATSDDGYKERWQTFRLYRKDSGKGGYILERLAESRIEGDVTLRHAFVLNNPHKVIGKLRRRRDDGTYYLTRVANQLLTEAARNDVRFREEAVEHA